MTISCNQYISFAIIGKLYLSVFLISLTVLYVDVCHVCYPIASSNNLWPWSIPQQSAHQSRCTLGWIQRMFVAKLVDNPPPSCCCSVGGLGYNLLVVRSLLFSKASNQANSLDLLLTLITYYSDTTQNLVVPDP